MQREPIDLHQNKTAIGPDISLCLAIKGVFRSRISRDSAGGAEERSAPQPEGIDGPRRAQRQLRLLPLLSTIALMKVLHQKKTGFRSPPPKSPS